MRRPPRRADVSRTTRETRIRCAVNLDGTGAARLDTPLGFLDHLLASLATHGRIDLRLRARGDLHVDQHHTVEDVGLVLGRTLHEALGDGRGIRRTGCFLFPMDEALGFAAIDLGGRASLVCDVPLRGAFVGDLQADVVEDFLLALARELRASLHLLVPWARSDHHALEAAFKALGKALREATVRDPRAACDAASTKGSVDR
ncbi:MAG: imidazoleglycerol-phosphate dehydratase HisB [Deltaproteobacteria bacterium]|nr:imidazoleglycerol-phosphate dehydratase HisB [Deltaproteobacteria bacterium]